MTTSLYPEPATAEPALRDSPDFLTCRQYLDWLSREHPEALRRVATAPLRDWCDGQLVNEYRSRCLVGHASGAYRYGGYMECYECPAAMSAKVSLLATLAFDRLTHTFDVEPVAEALQAYARELLGRSLVEGGAA